MMLWDDLEYQQHFMLLQAVLIVSYPNDIATSITALTATVLPVPAAPVARTTLGGLRVASPGWRKYCAYKLKISSWLGVDCCGKYLEIRSWRVGFCVVVENNSLLLFIALGCEGLLKLE